MNEFMGIKNVVDVKPIIGVDGCADGFNIVYQETKKVRIGRKTVERVVEKKCTKYIREFDANSIESDGNIHGFGKGTVYSRSTGKRKAGKKEVKMTPSGLKSVARAIGR